MLRALPILLLAGLCGCVYNPRANLAPDFGEALHADIASQVVNPYPLRSYRPGRSNGVRMESAYERFQNNKVYRPGPAPALQAATGGASGDTGSGSQGGSGSVSGGTSGSGSGASPY